MANRYGLDTDYIGKNLDILLRDIGNYTPEEMGRALRRIADTASPQAVNDEQLKAKFQHWFNHKIDYTPGVADAYMAGYRAALEGK